MFVFFCQQDSTNYKKFFLPDLDKKLYLALLEINGELPDIITVESESEWYPE